VAYAIDTRRPGRLGHFFSTRRPPPRGEYKRRGVRPIYARDDIQPATINRVGRGYGFVEPLLYRARSPVLARVYILYLFARANNVVIIVRVVGRWKNLDNYSFPARSIRRAALKLANVNANHGRRNTPNGPFGRRRETEIGRRRL